MKIQINCFDAQGKNFATSLELATQENSVNPRQHARVVRVLLNHLRQATSSTKTRGEVSFSTRKPWKQKGTGRARVSAISSPLWRKGGITFGPKPGCTRLSVNRKERQSVLGEVIKNRLEAGLFFGLELPQVVGASQTNTVAKYLNSINMRNEKVLFLLSSSDIETFRKIQNLKDVNVTFFDQLSVLELSKKNKILFLMKDKELMLEAFKQWI